MWPLCKTAQIYAIITLLIKQESLAVARYELSRYIKIILFAVLVIAVLAAWYLDALTFLTIENARALNETLGWWAPFIFVLAFMLGELLQVPSVLWIFFAGVIWPWWFAFPVSLFAALAAATIAFLIARYFLGDRIGDRLPKRVAELDEKVKRNPITAIVVIRLTTFLHPALHWVLAASSVTLPAFIIGTLIGIAPFTLALVLLGETFLTWWDEYSTYILIAGGLIIAGSVVMSRRRNRQLNDE